jgi:hypothetical protein
MKLVDSMRSMLGVRKVRSVPPPGPKPRLGARIVKDNLRITVQAGLTDATWHWLVLNGWREDTYRNDRRLYRDVPPSRVAELFDADDPDERTRLLQLAGAEATYRPRIKLANR